ncbi:MAG: GTPase domain-containing protein [Nitrospinota bacterium]
MVNFNYAARELTAKIVYYGPGLCGKTTNLEVLHKTMSPNNRGKMVSLATDTDRTLFFDLLPVDLGTIKGFKVKMQLFTVPGQTYYNATRKLVLKGADGVVFVAASQASQMDANVESYNNLAENLKINGLDMNTIALVIQYNKQDLPDLATIEELEAKVNPRKVPYNKAVAFKGQGVMETFKLVSKEVMILLQEKMGGGVKPAAKVKKIERADTAPVKITSEHATAYTPESAGAEQIAAESSLAAHGVEGSKRVVEELGQLAKALSKNMPDAASLVNDIRQNVNHLIEEQKRINFRHETILRQVNKLLKVAFKVKK